MNKIEIKNNKAILTGEFTAEQLENVLKLLKVSDDTNKTTKESTDSKTYTLDKAKIDKIIKELDEAVKKYKLPEKNSTLIEITETPVEQLRKNIKYQINEASKDIMHQTNKTKKEKDLEKIKDDIVNTYMKNATMDNAIDNFFNARKENASKQTTQEITKDIMKEIEKLRENIKNKNDAEIQKDEEAMKKIINLNIMFQKLTNEMENELTNSNKPFNGFDIGCSILIKQMADAIKKYTEIQIKE